MRIGATVGDIDHPAEPRRSPQKSLVGRHSPVLRLVGPAEYQMARLRLVKPDRRPLRAQHGLRRLDDLGQQRLQIGPRGKPPGDLENLE